MLLMVGHYAAAAEVTPSGEFAVTTLPMPKTLPDDTGYNTENNHGLETGWQEVADGLGRMLLGNAVQILLAFVFLVGLLILPDLMKSMRSINAKADWGLIVAYVGGSALALGWVYGYWLMLSGQWKCLAAPERRYAKAFLFASLLCLLAAPVLGILGGWLGGLDDLTNTRPAPSQPGLETRHYISIASGILSMAATLLFIFFLRACAECFDSRVLVWSANAYLLVTLGLLALALGITFQIVTVDFDPRVVQKGVRKGDLSVILQFGPLLVLGAGSVISYLWYLGLLWATRNVITNGLTSRSRASAAW